jgi:hypothetical protein
LISQSRGLGDVYKRQFVAIFFMLLPVLMIISLISVMIFFDEMERKDLEESKKIFGGNK